MTELRESFIPGSSQLVDFYKWMNERHRIYLARKAGQSKPWTNDVILQQYKFTNVFRELDPGTIALRNMEGNWVLALRADGDYPFQGINKTEVQQLILFNTWWWRIWNWYEHGPALGFVTDYNQLERYMLSLHNNGARMWTSAHMVRGAGGEQKVHTYLRMMRDVWVQLPELTRRILDGGTIQAAFNVVLETPLIGDFTAYEIASDLRWSLLEDPSDKYTWGNPGNGAIRGMRRLGLHPTVETMEWLWQSLPRFGSAILLGHFPVCWQGAPEANADWFITDVPRKHIWPPLEIREIEHSLCEFDKYERARLGHGKPRQKFDGVG